MSRFGRARQHFIYRCYDSAGRLLYLGCSSNVGRRMYEHERTSAWARFVADVKVAGPWPTATAQELEVRLIQRLAPIFNVDFNDGNDAAAYLAEKDPAAAIEMSAACRDAINGLAFPATERQVAS